MPLQQIRNQVSKLLFSGFFGKDTKYAGSFVLIIFFLSFLTFVPLAHASQTNGTISSAYKYAWSSVGGYINFAPTTSTVSVTDTGLSGYVWSENDGWINLSPSNGGVTNTVNGVLGGFAWDSLKGWVSFTGITIDSSGRFHGKAIGANETISFDCTHCDVRTDWRPISVRTAVVAQPVNRGFIGGFNSTNPLPGARTSSAKTTQQGTSTQHSTSSIISGPLASHNTGSPTQETSSISATSGIGSATITKSTISTTTARSSTTTAATVTSSSLLRVATHFGSWILLFLLIIFLTWRFFLYRA